MLVVAGDYVLEGHAGDAHGWGESKLIYIV